LEAAFSKKRHIETDSVQSEESLPPLEYAMAQDVEELADIQDYQLQETETQNNDHQCPQTETQSECLSLCCTDRSKPYQPTNKAILAWLTLGEILWKSGKSYSWLTLCTARKKVFCFFCKNAKSKGLMTSSTKAEATFTSVGFNNWKKALQKFQSHSQCDAHHEAVLKYQMLQTTPVSNQLSTQAKKEQSERRQALLKQLHCLRFLLRQGLAIRGHAETEGNLQQLLIMWSTYDTGLKMWMRDKRYLSPVIINELITIMGLNVLRSLLSNIKECSPAWYGIIADEATDVGNREQLNLSIRWVNNQYEIHEDPVGLYCLPDTKADTLYTVVTDILTRCALPLSMCRGQAFDGASNMQGKRNGLATKIRKEVPAALPVHCLAHCLNLRLQDAGRKLSFLRDALDIIREIIKLIRYSPKRAHFFQ